MSRIAPLPRGRHGLSRDEVTAAQRIRLAVAMADAMAEAGYVGTPVAAVLARAGVSRATFYELYEDKLACFLDALDFVGEVLMAELATALGPEGGSDPDGGGLDGARRAVARYLDTLVEHTAFARLYLVEVHAAGPEALHRRAALQDRLVDALAALLDARGDRERFACRAYVAAVASLVTVPVATGDREALRALRGPLLDHLATIARPVVPGS